MLKVVYVHYHMRSGGVTSVILRQIGALRGRVKPLLIIGEPPEVEVNCDYFVVPSLAYDRDRTDATPPDETAKTLFETACSYFNEKPDVFHIHNPTLGKNRDFISMIKKLDGLGANLFLQIHDFAEDGRPENYRPEPYPENVHYGVINSRDYNYLILSGLKEKGLHLIPNIVEVSIDRPDNLGGKRLVLYPVRAIRRKNIGEAIMLSLFLDSRDYVGITLRPTSEIDMKNYNMWMDYVKGKGLNVEFDLGIKRRFLDVVGDSKMMITTSIKEGFGMSFLEPWMFFRPLTGRLLRDICRDFLDSRVDLGFLYEKFYVSSGEVDIKDLNDKLVECYLKNLTRFGLHTNRLTLESEVKEHLSGGLVDFGILNEDMQRDVIDGILSGKIEKKKIFDLNPKVSNLKYSDKYEKIVINNRSIIKDKYSSERIAELLIGIYRKVLAVQVKHSIDKDRLIKLFNSVDNLSLLLCQ